jgi:hypothetical protein
MSDATKRVRTPGDKVVIGGEEGPTPSLGSRPPTGILKPAGHQSPEEGVSRAPSRAGVTLIDRPSGRSGDGMASRGGGGATSGRASTGGSGGSASLARQQKIENTKQNELKAKMGRMEQKEREAQRKRDEALRGKEKEKELKRLEEERKREEEQEKQRALEERREANVRAKMIQRERVAEHQKALVQEVQERHEELKERRRKAQDKLDFKVLERHSVGEFHKFREVEKKIMALRRVFVLLDYDGDGLISEDDMQKRMKSYGVEFDEEDILMMFDDVILMYGYLANLGGRDSDFWRWGMTMYQPEILSAAEKAKVWSPGWSAAATGANSHEVSMNDSDVLEEAGAGKHKAKDSSNLQRDVMRLFGKPPTMKHHDMIRNYNLESKHRIVTTDSVDSCTQGPEQHPPMISPRTPFDVAPQNVNAREVDPVVLTEGGMMTRTDVAAHLDKSKYGKSGFTWTEFRDCFITFSVDQAHESPIQFLSIVEFLMTDEIGFGTTNLEDAMELLFRRFGTPTDGMFVKLFGNECDPTTQMPLAEYLVKVDMLIKDRSHQSGKSSRMMSRSHSVAHGAHAKKGPGVSPGELRRELGRKVESGR